MAALVAVALVPVPVAATDPVQVGDPAPGFELTGNDGQVRRLGEALERGPLVLVFFRGTW
jgi:peroxiredoxin